MKGLRDSWAGSEISRPPCVLVEVPRKLSSAGEGDNTFCIEVSGVLANLMGKTGSKGPFKDEVESRAFWTIGRYSEDICGHGEGPTALCPGR
jgi:hypothetical protein